MLIIGETMPFFVVVDQMGVHVYEYSEEIHLQPGEVLAGGADTLEQAEVIEATADPTVHRNDSSVR